MSGENSCRIALWVQIVSSPTGSQPDKFTMTVPLEQAAINLAVPASLSAVIGSERQRRNCLAGLRTNTLVALGAASFVIFAGLIPGEASPTRVAAQVISGIGFLGAGMIFREEMSVRGLNTAATLWCSAAIGVLAGAGYPLYAVLSTGFVLFVNLLLRPIASFINRQPLTATESRSDTSYPSLAGVRTKPQVCALLLQAVARSGLAPSPPRQQRPPGCLINCYLCRHGSHQGPLTQARRATALMLS